VRVLRERFASLSVVPISRVELLKFTYNRYLVASQLNGLGLPFPPGLFEEGNQVLNGSMDQIVTHLMNNDPKYGPQRHAEGLACE
jgi:hypothetical protein